MARIATVETPTGAIVRVPVEPSDSDQDIIEKAQQQALREQPLGEFEMPPAGMQPPPIPGIQAPGVRVTPRAETPLQAATAATAGEMARLGTGALSLVDILRGQQNPELARTRERLEAESTERFSEYPIASILGATAPYMTIPGAAVSTMGRAAATGGTLGAVGSAAEPIETAISAAAGPAGLLAGRGVGRAGAGARVQHEPYTRDIIEQGRQIGLQTTPAQATGSRVLQTLEASIESSPFAAGSISGRVAANNQARANQIAARAIGEASTSVDPVVRGRAYERIGETMQRLSRGVRAEPDTRFYEQLGDAEELVRARVLPPDTQEAVTRAIDNLLDVADETGRFAGEDLQSVSSELGSRVRSLAKSPTGDRELQRGYAAIREAIDGLLLRSMPDERRAGLFRDARSQYRNLMFLERGATVRGEDVSARLLANTLRTQAKNEYQRAARMGTTSPTDQLFTLARMSEVAPRPFGSSGTAERLALPMTMPTLASGTYMTGDPILGAAMGFGLPALMGRAYSRWPFQTGVVGLPEGAVAPLGRLGARAGAPLTGLFANE